MMEDNRDAKLGIMVGVAALFSCCAVTVIPADTRLWILAPLVVVMLTGLVLLLRGDGSSPFE